jgi:S-adenosylmethionine hydrolase
VAGPFVSFLTDFGDNTAPAVCRGVIWSICPEARINDLTHASRQFAIRDGAFLLWSAIPYLPVGVHLAVVDPGVGTARRPIVIEAARGDRFVGPDNGLLLPAAERIGGIVAARELANAGLMRDSVSDTFHGRDIFAPMAAHLANGVRITEVGPAIDPETLVRIPLPESAVRDGGLDTVVVFIDAFGNCRLAGGSDDLATLRHGKLAPGDAFVAQIGDQRIELTWQRTFGTVTRGEPLLYEDADYAGLGLGVNQGSAADELGLERDTRVRIEPA